MSMVLRRGGVMTALVASALAAAAAPFPDSDYIPKYIREPKRVRTKNAKPDPDKRKQIKLRRKQRHNQS